MSYCKYEYEKLSIRKSLNYKKNRKRLFYDRIVIEEDLIDIFYSVIP